MSSPRVFVDTNVLVSAVIAGGRPGRILELGIEGELQLVVIDDVLREFARILSDKLNFGIEEVKQRLTILMRCCESVVLKDGEESEYVPGERVDSRIVSAAVKAQVDYLVTGDLRHIVPLQAIEGVPIVTPERFLQRLYGG